VRGFNERVRNKQTTLAAITNKLASSKFKLTEEDKTAIKKSSFVLPEHPANINRICTIDPNLSGNSLTEACYKTSLQHLIEDDPKLRGVPLRCAAVSKLCELRIRAENFIDQMSAREREACIQTKHVNLEKRLFPAPLHPK